MLGLSLGIDKKTSIVETSESISPSDISGLDVWFKVNTDIKAASGNQASDSNMEDGEDINSWDDQTLNNRHASQTVASRKPHWKTDSADFGGLVWPDDTADTHLNMATNVGGNTDNIAASEDFTIMIRVKLTNFDTAHGIIGSAAKEVIKWTSNARVGVFIGGNNPILNFEETGGLVIATDTYYIHTLTRSNGSTGNLTYHVHGGVHNDKDWDSAENHEDADVFTLNNIGCAANSALPTEGIFKDVLVWKGTALSDSQRNDMYTYINGQDY